MARARGVRRGGRTHDLIVRIQRETKLTAVSHLTCVCHTQDELAAILDRYAESEIENILATLVVGDRRQRCLVTIVPVVTFQYAEQLVRFVRSRCLQNEPRADLELGWLVSPRGIQRLPI